MMVKTFLSFNTLFYKTALALLCAVFLFFWTGKAGAQTFSAETFTLNNGMQVVLIPNNRAPVVTHMLWFKAGAMDEPYGKSGIAHYLEHLMFKGTEQLAPGEFSTTVKKLGGEHNAFTSWDYTAYFESVSVQHLETIMRMGAGRMQNLSPPEKDIHSELNVVIEERRQNIENNPKRHFREQLRTALYPHHPYGKPIIGWMPEIEKLGWEDAREYYDAWYTPANAILVVSGAVTRDELKALSSEIYGQIPARSVPERTKALHTGHNGQVQISAADPEIHQPELYRLYKVPGWTLNKEDSKRLDILSVVLGGGSGSRLYNALVIEQKLATRLYVYYDGFQRDTSELAIHAVPAEGVALEDLDAAIDAEILKLVEDGISEEEFQRAVNQLLADAIYARDSLSGPAMIVGRAMITGVSLDDIETWPEQIEAVSRGDVSVVADKYLNPLSVQNYVTGYLYPEKMNVFSGNDKNPQSIDSDMESDMKSDLDTGSGMSENERNMQGQDNEAKNGNYDEQE